MKKIDRNNTSLPISELIKDKRYTIVDLCNKARSIQAVNQKLKKCLDPSLCSHFELANIKSDYAILIVRSSSWATRLRYNIPVILNALNNKLNFTAIKTIRIKVKNIILDTTTARPKKPIPLSQNSARMLIDVANNFPDPALRECLLKLSKNHLK